MKEIPSLASLYSDLEADLKFNIGLTDVQLKMVAEAVAKTVAGHFKFAYLYLQDAENNIFPDTADTEANGGTLERQGRMQLNRDPKPATQGYYTASVTGAAGSKLRAQLSFKSNDSSKSPGNLYIIDAAYTLSGTGDVITIRAVDAGVEYALAAGDGLTPTEPVIGVNNGIVITGITQQALAAEDIEHYRELIIKAEQLETQGGARTDYREWASDAQGIERVYPYVKQSDGGTVQVFVEATKVDSTDGNGTPSGTLIDDVKEVLLWSPDITLSTNERGRIPIQATPEVLPIILKPVDVQIYGLATNTADIRAAIRSNLDDFLFDVRPFIDGADLRRDKNDILTSVKSQSVVNDTIGTANSFLGFVLYVDGVLVNTYTFSGGNIPYLRNVTFS